MEVVSKEFALADLHLDNEDSLVTEYKCRTKGYAEEIRQSWLSQVGENDIVYLLGDMFFGPKENFVDFIKDLPGYKFMARGNHDLEPDSWYLETASIIVADNISLKNGRVILTHKPVKLEGNACVNIHGHLHNMSLSFWKEQLGEDYSFLSERHHSMCPEVVGNRVVELDWKVLLPEGDGK